MNAVGSATEVGIDQVRRAVEAGATELHVVGDAVALSAVHEKTLRLLQKNGFASLAPGERFDCPRLPERFAVFTTKAPPVHSCENSSVCVVYVDS